jgi:hypothetical protein
LILVSINYVKKKTYKKRFVFRKPIIEIQHILFYDYQNNLKQYSTWHEYFKTYQTPILVTWEKNDIFFGSNDALAFQKDLNDVEVHFIY